MKPSQLAMLEDLGRCWMPEYETAFIGFVSGFVSLSKVEASYVRRLWNRYRMQILHFKKGHRK